MRRRMEVKLEVLGVSRFHYLDPTAPPYTTLKLSHRYNSILP